MRIAFDRFVALTAALAGAGSAVTACGSDPVTHPSGSGGSNGGSAGKGGQGGKGGAAGRSSKGGGSGDGGGRAGTGASAGRASAGTGGSDSGGSSGEGGAGTAGATGGSNNDAGAGTGGLVAQGGEAGESMGGQAGAGPEGGAGGAPDDVCLGDLGIADCSGLGLPTDECNTGRNQLWRSCTYGAGDLRPGVLEGLGACLMSIVDDSCTVEADDATYACETSVAAAACPSVEAADACANGVTLPGGGAVGSPLSVCTDGTLTQGSCSTLLNAVKSEVLRDVVMCADPAGEYGFLTAATCAERLHQCVFPRSSFYPW